MKYIFLPEHQWWYRIVYFLCATLFVVHQLLQKVLAVNVPFVDDFLDSFLLLPLVLHIILMERYWLFGIKEPLSIYTIVAFFILISIVSEIVFPWLSPRFTADAWDVLAFALGGIVYYLMQRVGYSDPLNINRIK